MKKFNVVFFGTPDFSVSSLKVLKDLPFIDIKSVVSMPDRPAGRGKKLQSPAVITYAKENGLPYFQTANINKEEAFLNQLENIDFYVVIAFAQFLGTKVLELPRLGAFNIHTSLLPKYRGAAPIQYALLNGDKETGVSIQKMVRKMDAGDIVYEHGVSIEDDETCDLLFKKLESEAALGLEKFMNQLHNDEDSLTFKKQDESLVSFAPTIDKKDGLINPLTDDAQTIYNKYRAYYPWPGVFLYHNEGKRLKITKMSLTHFKAPAGEFDYSPGKLILGTKEGALHLEMVQAESKKAVADKDFINTIKSTKKPLTLDESHYE